MRAKVTHLGRATPMATYTSYDEAIDTVADGLVWQREAIAEVRKYIADFLRYNGFDYQFLVRLDSVDPFGTPEPVIKVLPGDMEGGFGFNLRRYLHIRNPDERRMFVWKAVCDHGFIEQCKRSVTERLKAAVEEYDDIIAAQDLMP